MPWWSIYFIFRLSLKKLYSSIILRMSKNICKFGQLQLLFQLAEYQKILDATLNYVCTMTNSKCILLQTSSFNKNVFIIMLSSIKICILNITKTHLLLSLMFNIITEFTTGFRHTMFNWKNKLWKESYFDFINWKRTKCFKNYLFEVLNKSNIKLASFN